MQVRARLSSDSEWSETCVVDAVPVGDEPQDAEPAIAVDEVVCEVVSPDGATRLGPSSNDVLVALIRGDAFSLVLRLAEDDEAPIAGAEAWAAPAARVHGAALELGGSSDGEYCRETFSLDCDAEPRPRKRAGRRYLVISVRAVAADARALYEAAAEQPRGHRLRLEVKVGAAEAFVVEFAAAPLNDEAQPGHALLRGAGADWGVSMTAREAWALARDRGRVALEDQRRAVNGDATALDDEFDAALARRRTSTPLSPLAATKSVLARLAPTGLVWAYALHLASGDLDPETCGAVSRADVAPGSLKTSRTFRAAAPPDDVDAVAALGLERWLTLDGNVSEVLAASLLENEAIVAVVGSAKLPGSAATAHAALLRFRLAQDASWGDAAEDDGDGYGVDPTPQELSEAPLEAVFCFGGSEEGDARVVLPVEMFAESGAWVVRRHNRMTAFVEAARGGVSGVFGVSRHAARVYRRRGGARTIAWDSAPDELLALLEHGPRLAASKAYAAIFGHDGAAQSASNEARCVALVHHADATQRRAVETAVLGQSFVLRGPPGTGKSSTIALLALALVADGKRVLVIGREASAARVVATKIDGLLHGTSVRSLCAGPEHFDEKKKARKGWRKDVDDERVLLWRAWHGASALPASSFAAPLLDDGWVLAPGANAFAGRLVSEMKNLAEDSEDGDLHINALHRGTNARTGAPKEWCYVCELTGKVSASASAARNYGLKQTANLVDPNPPKKKLAAIEALRKRLLDLEDAGEPVDEGDWAARVALAAELRCGEARAHLVESDAALNNALAALAAADAAERCDALTARRCLEAALILRRQRGDVSRDAACRDFLRNVAEPFARSANASQSELYAVARIATRRHQGTAATHAALERCAAGGDAGAATAAARALLAAAPRGRRRLATLLVASVDLSVEDRHALFGTARSSARLVVEAARRRRAASLRLVAAAADAQLFADLATHPANRPVPLVACATPKGALAHGLLALASIDAVIIDEASQMPTDPDVLAVVAAAKTCIVIAGDDQQLPPRKHATGLLDDALAAARVPLVPLGWHYRSGDPSLIAVSNALFYDSRLVAPVSAPRNVDSGRPPDADAAAFDVCASRGLVAVIVDGGMDSAKGPPAGLVNPAQARAISRDAGFFVEAADRNGTPLSLGIVTLNRPQRCLIARLLAEMPHLGLEPHPTVPGALRRALTPDREHLAQVLLRDEPLFIESIDRIQGEEREVILFSTLLAPKDQGATKAKTPARPRRMRGSDDDSDADGSAAAPRDDDAIDALEELDDSDDSDDGEDGAVLVRKNAGAPTPSRKRRPAARRPQGARHYSTLTHAHGHRLLNVGITRAVVAMRCYVHPDCPAPSPHDDRAGRRAFGWLVRAVLDRPCGCSCARCTKTAAELKAACRPAAAAVASTTAVRQGVGSDESSDDDDGDDGDDDEADGENRLAAATLAWLRFAGRAVGVSTDGRAATNDRAAVRMPAAADRRGAVDIAAFCSRGATAVLCGAAQAEAPDWLDDLETLPRALGHPKLGWRNVARFGTSDVLEAIRAASIRGCESAAGDSGAIGSALVDSAAVASALVGSVVVGSVVVDALEAIAAAAEGFAARAFDDDATARSPESPEDDSATDDDGARWLRVNFAPHRQAVAQGQA
ncbi:hypothetical protein M885DRAFT_239904 [Pelagophyceae sp. CCMP2097]|nr:hypothetical protein M885DRAFT_239904 [Pelagophyceae sp. CCMP2097]